MRRTTVSAMPTHRRTRGVFWWIFTLWTACAFVLLGTGLWSYSNAMSGENPASLGEQRMIVYLGMIVLGFPINFFVPGYLSDLLNPHGYEMFSVSHSSAILFVRDWAIMLVLGWLQWFVVVPALVRVFVRRRNTTEEGMKGPGSGPGSISK